MPSEPVLLYDGTCGFCSEIVQFVLRRDRAATLRFAPLDGEFAAQVRTAFPEIAGVDSVVWVAADMQAVSVRSDAALEVARYLGGAWRLAGLAAVIPRPVRDWCYDLIARHRHRLIPRPAECFVPGADVRSRFI